MGRPVDRRQQVLHAAAAQFARRGYDGVSMADLAGAVGMTAPALYRHFADKSAILTGVIDSTAERMLDIARTQAQLAAGDRLAACVEAYAVEALDRPDPAVTYLRERHRLTGVVGDARLARERELFGLLLDPYREACPDLDPAAMQLRLIAALGAMRGWAERGVRVGRRDATTFLTGAVLAVLAAPGQRSPSIGCVTAEPAMTGWALEPSSHERILDAALPLFRDRGVAGVGIGEIGEASGVGATNVGRYVDSKEQILVDVYDRVAARVEVGLDDALRGAVDARDALERMAAAYCRIAFEAADLVVVVNDNRGAIPVAERPRLHRRDRRLMDRWRAVVSGCRPDLRRTEVATLVTALLPMVNMYPQQLTGGLPPHDVVAALVVELVIETPALSYGASAGGRWGNRKP